MCDTSTVTDHNELKTSSNGTWNLINAFGAIFVVVASAGGPQWLTHAALILSFPILLMGVGYALNVQVLNEEKNYLWRQIKTVYCPFWVWSVLFLMLHNVFLWMGFLDTQSGDWGGNVAVAFTWNDFIQRLWDVTFNMSGFDELLCAPFWFFRTLFIAGVVYLILFKLTKKVIEIDNAHTIGLVILSLSFLMALWQVLGNLHISGIAGGGYRELMGVFFISLGFLSRDILRVLPKRWWVALTGLVVFVLFLVFSPVTQTSSADLIQFISLPVPVLGAFIFVSYSAAFLSQRKNKIVSALSFIGDKYLFVIAFHLLAFKLISMIKVLVSGLSWSAVGAFPVVHENASSDFYFVLYILIGVALPLLTILGWRFLDSKYNLTVWNCLVYIGWGFLLLLKWIWKMLVKCVLRFWRSVKNFAKDMKEFVNASNPKDE